MFLNRTNWENYYMEIIMILGIVVYFLNFFTGKTKNQKIANQWFAAHRYCSYQCSYLQLLLSVLLPLLLISLFLLP